MVVAAVDEYPREPGRCGGLVAELVEALEALDETVLDRVLGMIADQTPRDRIEARRLLACELAETGDTLLTCLDSDPSSG